MAFQTGGYEDNNGKYPNYSSVFVIEATNCKFKPLLNSIKLNNSVRNHYIDHEYRMHTFKYCKWARIVELDDIVCTRFNNLWMQYAKFDLDC